MCLFRLSISILVLYTAPGIRPDAHVNRGSRVWPVPVETNMRRLSCEHEGSSFALRQPNKSGSTIAFEQVREAAARQVLARRLARCGRMKVNGLKSPVSGAAILLFAKVMATIYSQS